MALLLDATGSSHGQSPSGSVVLLSSWLCWRPICTIGRMAIRYALRFAAPCLGAAALLSSCSSAPSAAQQTASPRSACSLLTVKEAGAAFSGPVQPPQRCSLLPGNQSDGIYLSGGSEPGVLEVTVAWGERQVTTFTVSHSGHAHFVAPAGGSVASPRYARVTVSGVPAYWQLSPSPISGGSSSALSIGALKNGYVVILSSTSLRRSQDVSVPTSIIHHL